MISASAGVSLRVDNGKRDMRMKVPYFENSVKFFDIPGCNAIRILYTKKLAKFSENLSSL
jgi:hypothetical protein